MSDKYWYDLLQAWKNEGGTGLSFPFLIGAKEIIDDKYSSAPNDIEDLIDEMLEHDNEEEIIRIKWCANLRGIVVGLCDRDDVVDGKFFDNVVITGKILRDYGDEISDIKSGVISEYTTQIEQKEYSKNKGSWGYFAENEIEFIRKACT